MAWTNELNDSIARTRARMEAQEAETGGFRGEKRHGVQLRSIERNRTLLAEGQACSRAFGRVVASSGFRVAARGCSLDWGLVLLNRGIEGQTRYAFHFSCAYTMDTSAKTNPGQQPPDALNVSNEFGKVSQFMKLKLGDVILKRCFNTGWTKGDFNDIKSEVMLPHGSPEETTEWCMVGRKRHVSDGGDSGAWVLNEDGDLGGLVTGGTQGGNWTYVTPMEHIIKDIEDRLSCSVELP